MTQLKFSSMTGSTYEAAVYPSPPEHWPLRTGTFLKPRPGLPSPGHPSGALVIISSVRSPLDHPLLLSPSLTPVPVCRPSTVTTPPSTSFDQEIHGTELPFSTASVQ